MAESEVLYVNDMPLTDMDLHVTGHPGWMTGPGFSVPTLPLPGSIGGVPSPAFTVGAGSLSVSARLKPTSLTDRESKINEVVWRMKGLLELRFADQPDKVLEAICTNVSAVPESSANSFVEPGLIVNLSFLTPRPYRFDRYGQIISFDTSRTEVPLGDLPSGGVVTIMGAATNPTLTYRASSGESKETMGFTIALTSDDFLEVDLDKRTITKSIAGTRTRDDSIRTSGQFFTLDPSHGSPSWGAWPTLEVSTNEGTIAYHRNWSV